MTKRQKKAAREYRRKNRKQYAAYSKAWKARNPDWWKGRKYIQLLTSALINGNANSKVFRDSGLSMDQWILHSPAVSNGGLGALMDGSKLAPVKGWIEFDLELPSQLKAFLAPGNFKLVGK